MQQNIIKSIIKNRLKKNMARLHRGGRAQKNPSVTRKKRALLKDVSPLQMVANFKGGEYLCNKL